MISSAAAHPRDLTKHQLELARIDRELKSIGKRQEGLISAVRALTQRELTLAADLDLALEFNGKTSRPASTIAIELGEVRVGIGELERLRREADWRKAQLEGLQVNLTFALSYDNLRKTEVAQPPSIDQS